MRIPDSCGRRIRWRKLLVRSPKRLVATVSATNCSVFSKHELRHDGWGRRIGFDQDEFAVYELVASIGAIDEISRNRVGYLRAVRQGN